MLKAVAILSRISQKNLYSYTNALQKQFYIICLGVDVQVGKGMALFTFLKDTLKEIKRPWQSLRFSKVFVYIYLINDFHIAANQCLFVKGNDVILLK